MRPHDMGTLFDEAAAGGARTVVHLDRPFDIAPHAAPGGPSPNSSAWSAPPRPASPTPVSGPGTAWRS